MSEAAPSIPPGTPPAPQLRLIKNNEMAEKPVEKATEMSDEIAGVSTENWEKRKSGLEIPPGSMDAPNQETQLEQVPEQTNGKRQEVSADYGELLTPGSQQTREDQLMGKIDEADSLQQNNATVREARSRDKAYGENASEWIKNNKETESTTDIDMDKIREARSRDKAYGENASEWIKNNNETESIQSRIEEGQKKIGEAVNKRIQELMDGGMSEEDATDKATDEFLGRIKPEGNDGKEEPPGGENEGEDTDEGNPEVKSDEPSDVEKRAAEADAELQEAMSYLDTRVENFARARIALERILGGKNQEIFDAAERDLHDAYTRLEAARAKCLGIQMEQFDIASVEIQRQGDEVDKNMQKAQEALDNAKPEDDVDLLKNNVLAYEALKRENESKKQALEQQRQEVLAQNQEANLQLLNQVQQRVDAEMITQREAKHPRLAKFNEWMKKHPVARIAAGAVLAGAGVVGVVTGNIPLVVAATAGKAALAGYGGYNIVRGLGENRASKKFSEAEISNIADYTEAAESQSVTRRRSKKGGAVLGAALASIPIIKGIQSLVNMHTPGPAVPPTHGDPGVTPQPPTPTPWSPNPTDTRLPWTHMADQFGPGQATPRIMEIARRAPEFGWQIVGNNKGGGAGAILRMIGPNGQVYTDAGSFNSILDHLGTLMNTGPTM